ncbi:MAG TPA: hypothetical protein VF067_08410 [Sphingomicrobium sp.]
MRTLLLLFSILFLAAPASAEWWEARTEHFIIYSQDNEAATRAFATDLERYDHALRSLRQTKYEPVSADWQRVVIYRTGNVDFISRIAHAPAAGFYRPQMNPVAFTPVRDNKFSDSIIKHDSRTDLDPRSVLFHEYAHAFMLQNFPTAYPSWYIEAFAETVATIDLKPDGSFHVGNPPNWRADALFGGMLTVSPQSLLASTAKPDGEDQYGWYTVGWLVNHYLTFEPSRKGQLITYLRLMNGGMNSAQAARQAFGDLNKLASEIATYKRRGKLLGIDVHPATPANAQVAMRKLGPDEEAIMRAKVRTKAGLTRSEARDVAGDARAVARDFPNSYPVLVELAEAEFDAEHYTEAEAAADRALQSRPNGSEALIAKGNILLEKGKKDRQFLPAARIWFAKAHDVDTRNPEPLVGNYLTYFYEGGPIPESALIGLEQGYDKARQDKGLRLVLGRQLLAEKKGSLAKEIMLPLALDPHESKLQKTVRGALDLVDAGKVADAYAKLAQQMAKWEEEAKKGV